MTQAGPAKTRFHLPPQGLMMQLIAIILLPLTLILLAITFGSITVHQRAMRTMVGERDERAVNTAARAMSAQIDLRVKELIGISLSISTDPSESGLQNPSNIQFLSQDFDQGVVIFEPQGKKISAIGDSQLWDQLTANSEGWQTTLSELMFRAQRVKTIPSPFNNEYIGLIAVPDNKNMIVVGAFSITDLIENMLIDILPSDSDLSILLVDSNGQILYKSGEMQDDSKDHPGIAEALQGQSGTLFVKYQGDEHVTAYSPVVSPGWVLITEESWEAVSTPTLRTTQVAPLVLVPALLIMLLALWLGTRQIIKPLRLLESKAAKLAGENFTSIQEPVGGIAEIRHLQAELIEMANKVQDAQRSLHRYIGSITAAQEEERRRLARELHDDTLQALIALKQRVQLTHLNLQSSTEKDPPESEELNEIASLTENTIENLRRLTRALRPVYLEDLGLVPALEMLTREVGQGIGISVEFHHQGIERRLDPSVELALYRMVQEALSNVSRHARATQASVTIIYSSSKVILQVGDDGVGFKLPQNTAQYAANGHYGLLGLHERAELIGATLEIHTSPGKGTSLIVTLPT